MVNAMVLELACLQGRHIMRFFTAWCVRVWHNACTIVPVSSKKRQQLPLLTKAGEPPMQGACLEALGTGCSREFPISTDPGCK